MVPNVQILPWKGTSSIPVTGKWRCCSWVGDREPNQCLHGEADASVPWWLIGLGCQLSDGQCSALHARLYGEKAHGWGCGTQSAMNGCQEIWKRDVANQGGITEDIEELGLWGDWAWKPAWPGSYGSINIAASRTASLKCWGTKWGQMNLRPETWPHCLARPLCQGPCFTAE